MDVLYLQLFAFALFHCCLFLCDTIFKSCLFLPYLHLLKNTGLEIQPLRLIWFTTAFNRLIQKWGSFRPRLLTAWFTVGVWASLALLPYAVWLLLHSIFLQIKDLMREDLIRGDSKPSLSSAVLQPIVPGVTIPAADMGYVMLTVFFCMVIHELGHAISAVREDAHVAGVGAMLIFAIPIAYVKIEKIETVPACRQLRFLCAGVWHNIVLVLVAVLALFMLPWIVYPLYDHGTGVQVQYLEEDSPVTGPGGLLLRDTVVQLNRCKVNHFGDWEHCLIKSYKEPSPGFCLSAEFIKEHDESIPAKHLSGGAVECCASNNPRHLCFEYLESESEPLQLPQHSCLNVRTVVGAAQQLCHKTASSSSSSVRAGGEGEGGLQLESECGYNYHCFRPSLENNTKLILLKRKDGREVLFLGHPGDIFHTVEVSDYISLYSIFPSMFPEMFVDLCEYIVMFSSGLALVNILPVFKSDGQHISHALMDILLAKTVTHASVRHAIALCITIAFSFLVALQFVLFVWTKL